MIYLENKAKFLVLLLLSTLLLGCNSGGSGGDEVGPDQTATTELGNITDSDSDTDVFTDNVANTVTDTNVSIESNANKLLVDQPALSWTVCADQRVLECASLLVPIDYSNPTGGTISVAMARRQANSLTGSRTLVMNPGGPGGSGIDALSSFIRFGEISASVRDRFNFVSFDPRGIGESESVNCSTADIFAQNPYPTSRADLAFNFDKLVSFAQGCVESDSGIAENIGSFNVVRDINEMRKALGLTQIDFLGYSYGTRLAALYMQTYPESTGRFVLDGSMKPEPGVQALARGALLPGQANINVLAEACVDTSVDCSPDKFATDLQNRINELFEKPASQESALVFLILQYAATEPNPGSTVEQMLIGSLVRYLETRSVQELEFLDTMLGLSESAESQDNLNTAAFVAILCTDDASRPTIDSLDALRILFNEESNLIAETQLTIAGICAGWPESNDPIPTIATNQAPVSLVIGGPSDAQTPLVFAQQMAAAVGGQFLRSEHDGHTTVFTPKNNCTNMAVETFLLNGNLPATSVCEADTNVNASRSNWRDEMLNQLN